jgi:hypothetical protein
MTADSVSDTDTDKLLSPHVILSQLDLRGGELQLLCDALTSCAIGNPITAPRPALASPQHGFVTTTIWLSSWISEAWGISMSFLASQSDWVNIDAHEAKEFQRILGRLRTLFAHNLDPGTTRDRNTRDACYLWFKSACGSKVPSDEQWAQCLVVLLKSAEEYLSVAIKIARAIEQHPDANDLCKRWSIRLSRTDAEVDYLSSLQRAAGDLGLQNLNLHKMRNRYAQKWTESLAVLAATANLDDHITRHMEQALIAESSRLVPVTARDVMEQLNLGPGESVADALRLAQVIYSMRPNLERRMLLEHLAIHWDSLVKTPTPEQQGTKG